MFLCLIFEKMELLNNGEFCKCNRVVFVLFCVINCYVKDSPALNSVYMNILKHTCLYTLIYIFFLIYICIYIYIYLYIYLFKHFY